jgi:hypothetical protein
VVAAAVVEALSSSDGIATVFTRMVAILKAMHDQNPSWGPLFVSHPGNISRDVIYVPHLAATNGSGSQAHASDGGASHN